MNLFERAKKIKLQFPTRQQWENSKFEFRFRVLLSRDYHSNDRDVSIISLCKILIRKYFTHHYYYGNFVLINFDSDASYDEAARLMDLLIKYTKNWIYS